MSKEERNLSGTREVLGTSIGLMAESLLWMTDLKVAVMLYSCATAISVPLSIMNSQSRAK